MELLGFLLFCILNFKFFCGYINLRFYNYLNFVNLYFGIVLVVDYFVLICKKFERVVKIFLGVSIKKNN